jgi:hypothetical protein
VDSKNRAIAMWLMRKLMNASFPLMGRFYFRDHSTAMYGVQRVEEKRRLNPAFDALLRSMEKEFEAMRNQPRGEQMIAAGSSHGARIASI